MCTKQQLENIKYEVSNIYRQVYGANIVKIVLYGSYARGDYDNQSDIDVTAIVTGDRETLQEKLKIVWDIVAELGFENDIVISPTVIPENEYEKYKHVLPYYMNIEKEGVAIG